MPAPFCPYLLAFFLAQPLLFFAVVDFLVAALGISPHPLHRKNLTLFLAEVNEMGRTVTVRATEALDNYLCVGKGEGQRVELAFHPLLSLQNEDALNFRVAKQVVNVPVGFFVFLLKMSPQSPLKTVHCAARVDVTTGRESENAQLPDLDALGLIQPQVKLVNSLPQLSHRQAVLGSWGSVPIA